VPIPGNGKHLFLLIVDILIQATFDNDGANQALGSTARKSSSAFCCACRNAAARVVAISSISSDYHDANRFCIVPEGARLPAFSDKGLEIAAEALKLSSSQLLRSKNSC
jgi:hypothetical protein